MKSIIYVFFLGTITVFGQHKASSYGGGYNSENATAALIAALKSTDDIIIDNVGVWNIDPIRVFSIPAKNIIIEEGTVIRARSGAFPKNNDRMIEFINCSNINITAIGAIIEMRKKEYKSGEGRHIIGIIGCSNIYWNGGIIRNSGGDGIYIGPSSTINKSSNITIENVLSTNHRRQGISVVSVDKLTVNNCWFTNTNGTNPEEGIDIEPNTPHEILKDITFNQCVFTGNNGSGVYLAMYFYKANKTPFDIVFNDCYLSNNNLDTVNLNNPICELGTNNSYDEVVRGQAVFNRMHIENSQVRGFFTSKSANSYKVTLQQSVIDDVAKDQTIKRNYPLYIHAFYSTKNTIPLGNVAITNCFVRNTVNKPFLCIESSRNKKPLKDINVVNLTVVEDAPTSPVHLNAHPNIENDHVYIDYNTQVSLPDTSVTIENITPAKGVSTIEFKIKRTSTRNDYPLAVKYEVLGDAIEGVDYMRMTGSVIIEANCNSSILSIRPIKEMADKKLDISISGITN